MNRSLKEALAFGGAAVGLIGGGLLVGDGIPAMVLVLAGIASAGAATGSLLNFLAGRD